MLRNRLPRVLKHYSPFGKRNHGRSLKRLLDMWDRNGSTSGTTPWQIYMMMMKIRANFEKAWLTDDFHSRNSYRL